MSTRQNKKEYQKKYREANKDKQRECHKKWRKAHKKEEAARKKESYEESKLNGTAQSYRMGYYKKNKEISNKRSRDWFEKNKEYALKKSKEYQIKTQTKDNERRRLRYNCDLQYRLGRLLRGRLGKCLKNKTKGGSAVALLGCTVVFLIEHLERLFEPGMSWDNYGKFWSIDHIYPLSKANLENPDEIAKVCHYSNLQPLTVAENSAKSNKVIPSTKEQK